MSPSAEAPIARLPGVGWFMAAVALVPLLPLFGQHATFIGDPLSELPIKVYIFETFFNAQRFLGGHVDTLSFPNTGVLNNPDVTGTLVYGLLRPLLGQSNAYNLLIYLLLLGNLAATWALIRDLLRDELAALTGAVAFGLTPILLVYALTGAITDMLNLWPYPLAMMFALRALRRPGWKDGVLAGLMASLGVITCPYNFVVFASAAVPGVVWLLWQRGRDLTPVPDPLASTTTQPRQLLRAALGLGLVLGLIGGGYALQLSQLMDDPTSLISADEVAATRHAPPYPYLWPPSPDRYVAYLSDYFAVGKSSLIVRDLGARLYRAFSPGYLVMGLGLFATLRAPGRRALALWPAIAVFGVLASTGPFLPWSRDAFFNAPVNLVWIGLHRFLPGADMLMEAFRYALVAALGFAVAASMGTLMLQRRFGRKVGFAVPLAILLELVVVSPVPVPTPTVSPLVHPVYTSLDQLAGPGAVIELPYTLRGSQLFNRMQFYNQLLHGRPIVNEVQGFMPRYMAGNEFLARLLSIENHNTTVSLPYRPRQRLVEDRDQLVKDGFAAIIVDPDLYETRKEAQEVMNLLEPLGPAVLVEGRFVFALVKP